MGKLLFLLFTVVPVAEIALLMRVGNLMGAGFTVALVIATGIIGAALAKREGLRVLTDWQLALAQGRMPEEGVASGLLVLVGGVLLVTPGLLTDIVGFSLLIPAVRRIAEGWLKRAVQKHMSVAQVQVSQAAYTAHSGPGPYASHAGASDVEGEVIDMNVDEPR